MEDECLSIAVKQSAMWEINNPRVNSLVRGFYDIVNFSDFEIALIRFLYTPLETIIVSENKIGIIKDKTSFEELVDKTSVELLLPEQKTLKFCPDERKTDK